jgi:hypothetical protein
MPARSVETVTAVLALIFTSAASPLTHADVQTQSLAGPTGSLASADPVIAAAGDIACGADTSATADCVEMQTSDLLVQMNPAAVLPLGDVQYEKGQYDYFFSGRGPGTNTGYHPTWGRLKEVTHPVVGNHEYQTAGAKGYFDYFNGVGNFAGPAGERTKGYYSFDIGNWHLVALNSSCSFTDPPNCGAGSVQEQWLRADLTAHPRSCTLAYMHAPRWSSDYDTPYLQAMFQALYDHGVELLLAGHSHLYERFAPQDPSQRPDPLGVRQIVVGTGGRNVRAPDPAGLDPNSEVRNGETFGVLKVTLHPKSYDWEFVPIAGQTFTDSGSSPCHPVTPDITPPTAPTVSAARPDVTPPTVSAASLQGVFETRTTFDVSWGGATDQESGVATYSVSVRRAPHNGGFGAPAPFKLAVPAGGATFTGEPGYTYSFRATATDWDGNMSAAGPEDCTALPVDNVLFRHRGGWAKKSGSGYYLDTYSQTKRRGATLTLRAVSAKRLAIIVTKCPRCGSVDVFFRGKLVKRIRLRAQRMSKLRLVGLNVSGELQTGTVRVRAVSRNRIVRIEGFGVSAV